MITEFKNKEEELQYYKNYIRKMLRDTHKKYDFYPYLTALNNVLEYIEEKRDFFELRSFAYDSYSVDEFIERAKTYFGED